MTADLTPYLHFPAYNSIECCPKCLSGIRPRSRYCVARHREVESALGEGEWYTSFMAAPTAPEHIHRECSGCGYTWVERCADAPEVPDPTAPSQLARERIEARYPRCLPWEDI